MKLKKSAMHFALTAALTTALFCGCGSSTDNPPSDTPTPAITTTATGTPDSESTKAPSPTDATPSPTNTPTPSDAVASEQEPSPVGTADSDLTALELAERMGNGINLGNTMEAFGRSSYGTNAATSKYETFWGMPVTTQEMISGMKAAGFDSLRVPVAWTNAMNYESGDYTIGEDYLNRIDEIISYAINADMYVIVNDHWDGGWWGMFGSASAETRAAAMELYTSMWSQIAARYEKYSDKLIFESANEELGDRLNDTDVAKDSGTLSQTDCYRVANEINQAFVDTVRATGGNNANRFLLIAGYGTDITATCDSRFHMPTDTAKDKLLLSVHYYGPSGYCIFDSVPTWGTRQEYEEMNSTLSMLTKFTEQGYGIIIGEYGVLMKNKVLKEYTPDYLKNFLNNCDYYGYCPVLWDCDDQYNRRQATMRYDEIAQLYLEYSYARRADIPLAELKETAFNLITEATNAASAEDTLDPDQAVAWLMYTSGDWSVSYSAGDVYTPTAKTAGIVNTDVQITGEGDYTVALDFSGVAGGGANGVVFSAVGIANGEKLFPGYVIHITEIRINGEVYRFTGLPYTTSDDGLCTRANLYNAWVSSAPAGGRTMVGGAANATACLLDAETIGKVNSIEVSFRYVKASA